MPKRVNSGLCSGAIDWPRLESWCVDESKRWYFRSAWKEALARVTAQQICQ